jgi:hypothetical protein
VFCVGWLARERISRKRPSVPGSARPNLTLGFSKARGPVLPLTSVSSKMPNKPELTSSRPILSSSTESINYAKPSKPNKLAHIALAHLPGTLQDHRQSCSGGGPRAFLRATAHDSGSQGSRALSPTRL